MSWKDDFVAGERFAIKGHVFKLANIGKRALIIRHEPENKTKTESKNKNERRHSTNTLP